MEAEDQSNKMEKDSSEENEYILHKELEEIHKGDIYPLLSNILFYNIILQNKPNNENNKIIVYKKSIQKLLKLANIDESDIFSFILFYHNEINLEAMGENKDLYNINYNDLMGALNYFHINTENEDIKIHKSSLKKIIDLCGLIREEKCKYMNFFGIGENQENNMDYKAILNEKSSSSSGNDEEKNRIINSKRIIENKKRPKTIDILRGKTNKVIKENEENESEENKDILYNNRYNNKNNRNYLLDSDEEDYENNLLEKSYNILRARNKNNLNQMNNIFNDTIDNTYINTLDTINYENNLSISINESNNTKLLKPRIKPVIKRKKKIKRRAHTLFEISNSSSFSYLGSCSSLKKFRGDIDCDNGLIYPYNGFTKLSTSLTIEKQISQKELRNTKIDEEYCFFPFILRQTPELKNKVLYLSGSIPKLGSWDPLRAIKMDEEERNGEKFYTKYIEIYRREMPFEYKYFYYNGEELKWVGNDFENYISFTQFFDYLRSLKKSHISIMNVNIRYINNTDGINIWKNRKNKLIHLLLNKSADVLFFQEITRPQSTFIDKYLSSIYEFVGDYRDSSINSEKCSICVNKLKYTIIHHGQFWLSSTPYIPGSNDFGNFFPRICTWASFKQIDGISLLFMNVHLDHANKKAHLPSINVILNEEEKIVSKFPDIKFVFIGGCFYCEENDEEINYIKKKGYNEIKFENTYHGFTGKANNHWDYMFWKEKSGEDIEVKETYVLKKDAIIDKDKNCYVSDHFPVYVEFFHKNKK